MLFQNLIEKVDILSSRYVISFKSGDIHSKLISENFYKTPLELKVQFIEKILCNNFKKIYIRMYFKNKNNTNKLINNMVIFKIDLIKKSNRLYIKSINCLLYLENIEFVSYLKKFFNDNYCECNINTIETDIKKINKINNKKCVKINSLKMNNLFEFFTFKNLKNVSVICNSYKDEIRFELHLEYTFLKNIFKDKKIMIGFDNYVKEIEKIQNEIYNYNIAVKKAYDDKLFRSLKNNKFMFFLTESEIKNTKDLLKILKQFKNLLDVKTDEEKLAIYKKLSLLKQITYKKDLFDLIKNIENFNLLLKKQINCMDISIVKIPKCKKHMQDLQQKLKQIQISENNINSYKYYYLKFKISELYIYIDLTLIDISEFEKIQKYNIIFSLLKKILSNTIITDELEKTFFEQN